MVRKQKGSTPIVSVESSRVESHARRRHTRLVPRGRARGLRLAEAEADLQLLAPALSVRSLVESGAQAQAEASLTQIEVRRFRVEQKRS